MKIGMLQILPLALGLGLALPAFADPGVGAPRSDAAAIKVQDDQKVAGWSVKRSLLGKSVYNEKDEKIGVIDDLLIGMDSTISHVVVDAGSFVGKRRHEIAIDASALQVHGGIFYVEGANRENVGATPSIDFAASI
jgi:sporulation protein YlmC with PRC-barrel domain